MTLIQSKVTYSRTWTYFQDAWHEGNVALMGPRTHGAWLGSTVFDGARAFDGLTPDLDLHCARVNRSAEAFMLKPVVPESQWLALAHEGIARFDGKTALYIRPMYWAENGMGGGVKYDPDTTQWCLSLYEAPLIEPKGTSVTLSPFRRPTRETAPLEAKAGCLYPNNARAIAEANARGFDNALMCDMLGNVAELANANVFLVRDGIVQTSVANGTFLSGITRARMIGLFRKAGLTVEETTLRPADFLAADEIFSTGNYNKLAPVTQIETRKLEAGPVYALGRKLYMEFAKSGS